MKIAGLVLLAFSTLTLAQVPPAALKYRADLTREAHFVFGLDAPIDYLAGQIQQESGWRPGITAWDNGRGLAQFMDPTAAWAPSISRNSASRSRTTRFGRSAQ